MNEFTKLIITLKDELENFQKKLIEDANDKLKHLDNFQAEFENLLLSAATFENNKDMLKFAKQYSEEIENKKILEEWESLKSKLEEFNNGQKEKR